MLEKKLITLLDKATMAFLGWGIIFSNTSVKLEDASPIILQLKM